MKIILHIGTDKTGSTAIQKHLYVNRQWLLARGVYVPLTCLGKDNSHGGLLSTMEQQQMICMAEELAIAASEGYDSAVISWEGMCYMSAPEIEQLVNMLPAENCWLLVYLREQADIVQTGYLQEIKTDKSRLTIADFQRGIWKLSHIRALLSCYSPTRNYANLLRKWMHSIRKGQVIIREFQRDLLVNKSVVDDFLAVVGQSADNEFLHISDNSNISLDVESATILNDIDKRDVMERPRKYYAFSLLSLIHSDGFGARHFLSAHRVASIRRYYRRSNNSISDVVGTTLPELFLNPPNCVRTYTKETMLNSVSQKKERFSALLNDPMLITTKKPHVTPERDLLVSGWDELQDWGAWSIGDESKIRFRAPFWMVSHERAKLVISLKGRYLGRNIRSKVIVNDLDFGWIDLRNFSRSISLPIAKLYANQIVELQVIHEFPENPAKNDSIVGSGPLAFGIEKLGIQFSNPD
jgi:hypothetical protein